MRVIDEETYSALLNYLARDVSVQLFIKLGRADKINEQNQNREADDGLRKSTAESQDRDNGDIC
ncbi:MAG: hypothetical protein K6A15_09070 [Treponema sp.]|nr:hypothetical protein [Treponema sp.]